MKYFNSLAEMIGRTPLLRLGRIAPEHQIYAKCEFMNPLSVKDRPVLQIIEDAEREGRLKSNSTLIEATSGNTGMAVAFIGAIRGHKVILIMSEIQSLERRKILKALGADLILTPAAEGTSGAKRKLQEILSEHPEYFYIGQHINPSNPKAHYLTTGPELWDATDGRINILVAALGTGGTICGAGRYLKERNPEIRTIAIEPEESPFISKGVFCPHRMMGTAPGFIPEVLDREMIDEIFLVSEAQAFQMCRRSAREEGVLVGITSGAALHAAVAIAGRPENTGKVIVTILADSGQRYLSVEGLFDE